MKHDAMSLIENIPKPFQVSAGGDEDVILFYLCAFMRLRLMIEYLIFINFPRK